MIAQGLLCHIDTENQRLTVVDFIHQDTLTIKNVYGELELGQFYRFTRDAATLDTKTRDFIKVKFEVSDGMVQADTQVICLNTESCEEEVYKGKVISPQLGFVSDPNGLLSYSFEFGLYHKVHIRFSQHTEHPFEVVELGEHGSESRLMAQKREAAALTAQKKKAERAAKRAEAKAVKMAVKPKAAKKPAKDEKKIPKVKETTISMKAKSTTKTRKATKTTTIDMEKEPRVTRSGRYL